MGNHSSSANSASDVRTEEVNVEPEQSNNKDRNDTPSEELDGSSSSSSDGNQDTTEDIESRPLARPLEGEQSHKEIEDDQSSECSESIDSSDTDDELMNNSETPPVCYYLKLHRGIDESISRSIKLVTHCTPKRVVDIKLCIERELSIPACCQEVTFEAHQLKDDDSLDALRIREGDTLTVKYQSEGMVKEVREIIKDMKSMNRFLRQKSTRRKLQNGCSDDAEISNNLDPTQVELLATTYFHPSADPKSKANRLFFVSNGGLQVMHQLHEELLRYNWDKQLSHMQYLEHSILRVLWNLSAAFSIRLLLLQRPTLEAVIGSLVRAKIPAYTVFRGPPGFTLEYDRITCEMLYKAIGTIGNLAEIPQCRVVIASRKDVLDQLLASLTSPTYTFIVSLVSSAGLLCLAYSPETHKYLITDNVIQKFTKALNSKSHTLMDTQLLKYFRCVFYALLLYNSASQTPLQFKRKMGEAIREFLSSAEYANIHTQEKKKGYIWSTVAHFVKLAYFPKHNPQWTFCSHQEMIEEDDLKFHEELEDLCIEAGVFSLQNVLLSDDTRDILEAEHLVDYIVCLPWHLSPETRAYQRACHLRQFLSSKMQLEPPSLVNLAKAKLAVGHCGLERALNARSLHDIVDTIGK